MKDKLLAEFPEALTPRPSVDGILAFDCKKNILVRVAAKLRDDFEYQVLTDLASIDMGTDAGEARFGAVYHFYSHTKKNYIRLVAMCDSQKEPKLPSLYHQRKQFICCCHHTEFIILICSAICRFILKW